jgi:RimJ/RimL family protein N-acetyltransferase
MAIELKIITDSELEAFHDLMNDFSLAQNAGTVPHPITMEWARERLNKKREGEVAGTAFERGLYEGDVLVGTVGWFNDHRHVGAAIGYAIHRDHRGKGLATLAARMIVDILRDSGYRDPIYADYFQDNPASGRVLEKIGFKRLRADMGTSMGRQATLPSWVVVLELDEHVTDGTE